MRKLRPVIPLVSCAADEPMASVSSGDPLGSDCTVGTLDVPLNLSPSPGPLGLVIKEFPRNDARGRIQETGAWNIRTPIAHPRLRCTTYEAGIQLGQGNRFAQTFAG